MTSEPVPEPPDGNGKGAISLRAVTKRYGDGTRGRRGIPRHPPGEFFSLLGPSGSGKTTTLMMIAGFADGRRRPDRRSTARHRRRAAAEARLRHGVPELRDLPAPERLRERRLSAAGAPHRRRSRSASAWPEALAWCASSGSATASPASSPAASSSASRSRAPSSSTRSVVLMDEPLGALDKNLRYEMQVEIKEIQTPPRHDGRLRHARPGRGDEHVRPHRDHESRPHRAGRTAGGDLRAPRQHLHRALPRRGQPDRRASRRCRRRRCYVCASPATSRLRAHVAPAAPPARRASLFVRPERVALGTGAAGERRPSGEPRRRATSGASRSSATSCATPSRSRRGAAVIVDVQNTGSRRIAAGERVHRLVASGRQPGAGGLT